MAICYDFDGTLAPGNIQEYDYIPNLRISTKEFWNELRKRAEEQKSDDPLAYMALMIEKAKAARKDFFEYAKKVELFKGVGEWFARVSPPQQNTSPV